MQNIPIAPVKRLMKETGAERISDKAVELVLQEAENYIKQISAEALDLARYNNRKTVLESDVEYILQH